MIPDDVRTHSLGTPFSTIALLSFAIVLTLGSDVRAGEIALIWDASSGPEPGGYLLHYGKSSGNYTSDVDVGNQTQYTVTGLAAGATYYFVVTACDVSRQTETGPSNEISAPVPGGPPVTAAFTGSPTAGVELLEAKRLGKVKKPRKSLEKADTSPGVRGISAPVKRFVWERDQGQCTYESRGSDGRRCPERRGLQFHHDDPYGLGGDRGATNVRLMCAAHNLYLGEMDCGKDKMDQYRRPADRVREPSVGSATRSASDAGRRLLLDNGWRILCRRVEVVR